MVWRYLPITCNLYGTTMRHAFTLLMLLACLPAMAAPSPAHTPASTKAVASKLPFMGLLAGETRRGQAEMLWQQKQASVYSLFHGNALENYPQSGEQTLANLRVVIADIRSLPMPELENARFAFFDDLFYRVSASYRSGVTFQQALEKLGASYGPPDSQSGSSQQYASWQRGDVWLMLMEQIDGQLVLQLEHTPLARKVRTSNTETYAAYIRAKRQYVTLP